MNILFTGGTGLIGRHFIRRYPTYRYTVLSRSKGKAAALFSDGVNIISSLDELNHLDDFDAVINLAGEPIFGKRWSDKQKSRMTQSRWDTTRELVKLIQVSATPPKVFLSGSAIGIYGDRGRAGIDEFSDISPNDFSSELCRKWESIALQAHNDIRVVLQRTGIVLSTEGGALEKMLLPFKLNLGGRIGSGQQYMSWIHIDDIVRAMNFVLHNDSCAGPINMVAPGAVPNAEFTQTLAAGLGRTAPLPAPAPLVKLGLGEASQLLLNSQRVAPSKLLNAGFEFRYQELQSAIGGLLAS